MIIHFWLVYDSSQKSRRISFLLAALAEALHERLHAAADRLAAEAEQRKAVQLEIGRHPVRIGRANRITLRDMSLALGIE